MSLPLPSLKQTLKQKYYKEYHRQLPHSNFWPDDPLWALSQAENPAFSLI